MKNSIMKLIRCILLLAGIVIVISVCTKVLSSHVEANAASAKGEIEEVEELKSEVSTKDSLVALESDDNTLITGIIEDNESLFNVEDEIEVAEVEEIEIEDASTDESEEIIEETTGIYISEEDQIYLQKIAFAEARTEGVECMALVMLTILNRVESDEFPNTIYEVITQKSQFTPVSNGSFASATPDDKTQEALDLVLSGWDNSQGSLYFESCSGSSWHSRNLTYLFQSGDIRFYK